MDTNTPMLKPPISLLVKLGSILVHVEEGRSAKGHPFDWNVIDALMADPEVAVWLKCMDKAGLLPVKR